MHRGFRRRTFVSFALFAILSLSGCRLEFNELAESLVQSMQHRSGPHSEQ